MIAETSDGRIWAVDSNRRRAPRHLNPDTEKWTLLDLRAFGGTRQNYSILEPEKGRILISGVDALSYCINGKWRSISNLSLDLSVPVTFMNSGADGFLWILENSRIKQHSRLARIDYVGKRWKEFEDLNFQCDLGNGTLCFLTGRGELVLHDTSENDWTLYTEADGLIDNAVVAICSERGEVWVAGSHRDQAAAARFDGDSWHLYEMPELGARISRDSAQSLSDGSLVFAYGQEGGHRAGTGGIVRFHPRASGYNKEWLTDLKYKRVISIQEDGEGNFLYSKNRIVRYEGDDSTVVPMPIKGASNWVDGFQSLPGGELWYCSWGQGVHAFDGESWRVFTKKDGLSSDFVSNVLVKEDGTVFALTAKGLDRFRDGEWQRVEGPELKGIRSGSSLRESSDGSLWVNLANRDWYHAFGDRSGLDLSFRSFRFRADELAPETRVSFVMDPPKYSNSAYVSWSGRDPWTNTPVDALQFSYQFDHGEWTAFSSQTGTYLSDLDPGDHLLRVKARDSDLNVDASPAALAFTVSLPFWESSWFIGTAIAVPIVIITLIFLLLTQRIRHMAELDGVRARFLMNVSHELRAPLSLIMMPLEKLMKKHGDGGDSRHLTTALRSAKRLNQLVEQLLDLQQAKAHKYKLNAKRSDIVRFTRTIVADFENLAASRGQRIGFYSTDDTYVTFFDEDIYRKMLDNLVLNAIKHSPEGADISVMLRSGEIDGFGERKLRLIVEDNGSGIQRNVLKRIFEPFYRHSENSSQRAKSYGIGLALVKELVDFCQAKITAESPIKKDGNGAFGSRFTIEFEGMPPVPEKPDENAESPVRVKTIDPRAASSSVEGKGRKRKGLILLVDDHSELREYIAEELAAEFTVIEAGNGREGIDLATRKSPDLIIADIVMPGMDGVAFCQALKENVATSHIPIILQTSLGSEESIGAGFEAGAIDYITKPTSISLIKKRVRSHLEARKAQAKYLSSQLLELDEEGGSESSEKDAELEFVKKIRSILDQRWSESSFSADKLASEMGMGRTTFYRKCKVVLNIPPAEAIKSYRLGKAKELLESGMPAFEVATLVGYSEASPFNRAFKKRYRCNPSEVQKGARV
ncbi:response regulator [Pelagicoccus sp. SDUM812005]|nr:response regulator [Pelagicoccus sp. SDUM812005]